MNDSNREHFKGLSLEPEIAFRQIAAMIETGVIISAIDLIDESELSDDIFYLAQKYAEAAHNHARNIRRAALTETPLAPVKVMQDVDMSTTGDRIQLARENLGLTEADVARALGTYSDHISDWECGITEPPAGMIIPLANALKCDLHWLLTGDGRPVPAENNQAESTCKSETLGDRIKSMREAWNLGQSLLASSIGVTRSCVEAWEENATIPGCDKILPLANALSCDPLWLLMGRNIEIKNLSQ